MRNTYRDIAKSYIRGNKNKNIILFSTIILVTLFLTLLLIFYCSLDEMTKNQRAESGQYYYGAIADVSDEYKGKIENHALVKEYLEMESRDEEGSFSIYLLTESKSAAKEQLNTICEDVGISNDKLRVNDKVLNRSLTQVIKDGLPYIVMILMVLVSSFFIIYNIYFLTFKNRLQHYGLLKTIGFTKNQLMKCMFWEIAILSIVSIPIGIFFGVVLSKALIPFVPYDSDISIVFRLWMIPVIAIIVFITIIISANTPLKKVIRLSSIQSKNFSFFNGDVKEKDFSDIRLESALSRANILRNKRTTCITILSLVLSSVVFIMGSTVVKSMDVENQVRKYLIYSDIKIWLEDEISSMGYGYITEDMVDGIKKIQGISKLRSYKVDIVKEVKNNNMVGMFGLNDDAISELNSNILDGYVDKEKMLNENGVIYFCRSNEVDNPRYKVGEKVEFENELNDGSKINTTMIVQAIVLDDMSNKYVSYITEFYVLDRNKLVKDSEDYVVIQLDCDYFQIEKTKNILTEITKNNPNIKVNTVDDFVELKSKEKGGIIIISYSIFIILGIIASVNYINLLATSILDRKREFSILRAVGLERSKIKKIISKEYIFISGLTAILSCIIGNVLGYLIVDIFSKSATYVIYSFPYWTNILFVVFIFIIPGCVTNILGNKVLSGNIVESIKYKE